MTKSLPGLIEPLKVRDLMLRNRIVMPPMQTGKATFEGGVTNRLINHYVKRSGAVGLPIVEHAYVSLTGKLGVKQLGIYDDALVPGFEKLAAALHSIDAPAILQITHAGAVASKKVTHAQPVGPSSLGKARGLEKSELEKIIDQFTAATERAVKAGFDGVELHGAHGYLLCQFFSPLLNRRCDEFGGSLEGRMHFPLMVVKRVREVLKGKTLLYRLGADDLTSKGTRIEDSIVFARELEKSGVDIIDVSGGMCGAEPKQLLNVEGYFLSQAQKIKKTVNVPVIGVGGITDAHYADRLVREGSVDLVAVGRALLKDALWAEKAVEALSDENVDAQKDL